MSDAVYKQYDKQKDVIIGKLLDKGIYKTSNRQLYELSLSELESAYRKLSKAH